MFESSFLEMLVVGVIALLVIGPERLPGLARKVGRLIGKARAFIATTRSDIERELRAEELRSMLSRQEEEIRELRQLMQQSTEEVRQGIDAATKLSPPHDAKN
ncbi:MAG: Sec-independent protein translocase protein TatB [Thiothrix sp.]